MKTHAALGGDAIATVMAELDEPIPLLEVAHAMTRWHHERWDGSGYPDGLAGTGIPLEARIMAMADVFDALISRRVYKPAFSFAEAREEILIMRGGAFPPTSVTFLWPTSNVSSPLPKKTPQHANRRHPSRFLPRTVTDFRKKPLPIGARHVVRRFMPALSGVVARGFLGLRLIKNIYTELEIIIM